MITAAAVLMGKYNSYMPRWLDRVTPGIGIKGVQCFAERDQIPEPEPEPTLTP